MLLENLFFGFRCNSELSVLNNRLKVVKKKLKKKIKNRLTTVNGFDRFTSPQKAERNSKGGLKKMLETLKKEIDNGE